MKIFNKEKGAKKVESDRKLCEYIQDLPEGKMYGIINHGSYIELTECEVISKEKVQEKLKESTEKYNIYKKGLKNNPNLSSQTWKHYGEKCMCEDLLGIKRTNIVTLDGLQENQEEKKMKVESYNLNLKEGHAVCFDFDGVIHKYSEGWKDGSIYDEANKEVLDLMLLLVKSGIPVFICSTREPLQIINWWNKQGFWCEAVRVNDNETFWNDLKFVGVTNRKLPAQLYIDDRAYKYTGQTVKEFIIENSEKEEN